MTPIERYIEQETQRQLTATGRGIPIRDGSGRGIRANMGRRGCLPPRGQGLGNEDYQFPDVVVKRPEQGFFTRVGVAIRQFKWWELLLMGTGVVIGGAALAQAIQKEPKEEVRFLEPVKPFDTPAG